MDAINPKNDFSYSPGIVSVVTTKARNLDAGLGYGSEMYGVEYKVDCGLTGGSDTIHLDYRRRLLNLELTGLGFGYFWRADVNFKIGKGFNLSLNASQRHYFGNINKFDGMYNTLPEPGYPMGYLIFGPLAPSGQTYASRTSQAVLAVKYAF